MSKEHIVVYHDKCNDGTAAAAVVIKWLKEKHNKVSSDIILVPCQYNQTDNQFSKVRDVLPDASFVTIVDFSFPPEYLAELVDGGFTYQLFDHHKTAIPLAQIPGCVINKENSMSGAMWVAHHLMPELCNDRLIKHVDDYDRWQFKLPGTKAFAAGLKFLSVPPEILAGKLGHEGFYDEVLNIGYTVMAYEAKQIDSLAERSLTSPIWCTVSVGNSIQGVAINTSYYDIMSNLGSAVNEQSYEYFERYNIYPLFTAMYQLVSPEKISVSIRANEAQVKIMQDRYGEDCSTIAKRFGGGGHAGAAGFSLAPDQWFIWLDEVKVSGTANKGGD